MTQPHDPSTYLATKLLEKLAAYYLRPDTEEVVINRPGEIWVKPKRQDWQLEQAPELTYEYLGKVCRVLANVNKATFNMAVKPIVSCSIPGKPFRFQAIMGPNVTYELGDNRGVGIAIRSLIPDESVTVKSYGLVEGVQLPGAQAFFDEFDMDRDVMLRVQDTIRAHLSVVIAGGTSTGKTTLFNRLLHLIPLEERVVTVEDVRELQVPHLNRLHLRVERNAGTNMVDYNAITDVLMRITPDWICCGELSVANAMPIYTLMGKGHPIMTTVHAGTPEEAIRAFVNNMASAGSALPAESTMETLRSQIGCIIQIDRRDGKRKVTEVTFPMKELADKRNREKKG